MGSLSRLSSWSKTDDDTSSEPYWAAAGSNVYPNLTSWLETEGKRRNFKPGHAASVLTSLETVKECLVYLAKHQPSAGKIWFETNNILKINVWA